MLVMPAHLCVKTYSTVYLSKKSHVFELHSIFVSELFCESLLKRLIDVLPLNKSSSTVKITKVLDQLC